MILGGRVWLALGAGLTVADERVCLQFNMYSNEKIYGRTYRLFTRVKRLIKKVSGGKRHDYLKEVRVVKRQILSGALIEQVRRWA